LSPVLRKICLFDEGLFAWDDEDSLSALLKLLTAKKITVVFVANSISAAMMADRIAVIHQGDVVQDGTHTELMAETTGVYAELANKQIAKMALISNNNAHGAASF